MRDSNTVYDEMIKKLVEIGFLVKNYGGVEETYEALKVEINSTERSFIEFARQIQTEESFNLTIFERLIVRVYCDLKKYDHVTKSALSYIHGSGKESLDNLDKTGCIGKLILLIIPGNEGKAVRALASDPEFRGRMMQKYQEEIVPMRTGFETYVTNRGYLLSQRTV